MQVAKAVELPYARRYSILVAVMVGHILGPLNFTIANVVLPTIAESFQVGLATAQWVLMIYMLTTSSLFLLCGRLGDIWGYKKMFLSGLGGFIIASVLCGLSTTIPMLILFRAIQGLFAAMTMSMPYAIVTASFPPNERGRALGLHALGVAVGLAMGPSLGGFITSLLGWRFVFLINVPIGVLALFWAQRAIPVLKGQSGKLDIPGATTAFIFLGSFLFSVNRFQYSGLNSLTGIMLLVAAVAAFGFFQRERRAAQPMLDLNLLNNRTFSFANISALLNFLSQSVMVFLTPFYLQRVLHYTVNNVGLVMTAFPLAAMAMAPFSGALSDRMGTRGLACIGAALCALSLFFMSQLSASASSIDVAWRLAVFGVGSGIFQSPNHSAVMGSIPRLHFGVASAIMATTRNVGMLLGVVTSGVVLYAFVSPQVLQQSSLETSEAVAFLSGLRYAYLAGAILTAMASVTSLVRSRGESKRSFE